MGHKESALWVGGGGECIHGKSLVQLGSFPENDRAQRKVTPRLRGIFPDSNFPPWST